MFLKHFICKKFMSIYILMIKAAVIWERRCLATFLTARPVPISRGHLGSELSCIFQTEFRCLWLCSFIFPLVALQALPCVRPVPDHQGTGLARGAASPECLSCSRLDVERSRVARDTEHSAEKWDGEGLLE